MSPHSISTIAELRDQPRTFAALAALRTITDALRESLAASRQYQRLRARGVAHDAAIRESLGIGGETAQRPQATDTLCFAGKA